MSDNENPTPGYARVVLGKWALDVSEITELVKAARAHVKAERAMEYAYPVSSTLDALEAAIKPFEGP